MSRGKKRSVWRKREKLRAIDKPTASERTREGVGRGGLDGRPESGSDLRRGLRVTPGVGARIARPLGCAVRGHSPTAAGPQSLRRGRPVWPPVTRVRLQQAVTRRRRFRAAIQAAPTATTEVRRYKRLFAATAPATRDRFAARADVGIGPYGEIVSRYVRRRHSDTAGIRTRNARYLRRGRRDCA